MGAFVAARAARLPSDVPMQTEILLQHFLMFIVVPVWLLAGVADYACHRSARIEETSGVFESLLHIFQFSQVGVPLLAALFLEINAGVLAIMFAGLVLHQATAIWDVRYANQTRHVPPVEQHLHGVLEISPAIATAVVCILHWSQFLALLGMGEASFALELKRPPLPTWYLAAVMAGVAVCGVLPYGEELIRTVRAARFAKARRTDAGP